MVFPGLEPADDVCGKLEAELDEVARRENRRVAVIANEDQPLIQPAEVAVSPPTIHGNSPLEYGPRNMDAPGDHAVDLAIVLGADVDHDPSAADGKCLRRMEPDDPPAASLTRRWSERCFRW